METTINIASFGPAYQSAILFTIFEGLREGESYKILVESDPFSIRESFKEAEIENFDWEASREGSGRWTVRISKLLKNSTSRTGCCGSCGGASV